MSQNVSEISIRVGIVGARSLKIVFSGAWDCSLPAIKPQGELTAGFAEGRLVEINGCRAPQIDFTPASADATFLIREVIIGVDFHWQRPEDQRFEGALQLVAEPQGQVRAINVINVEDYLRSVISSEMSANSPFELLKAHAVISRSWLLAQIFNRSRHADARSEMIDEPGKIVRWFDREDHHGFDVCADDHCQRYQGITRAANPLVARAVEATRGQVLVHDGRVCDTRFSKCCGGRTEVFESCWADDPHPYLVSIDDPWCDTHDEQILRSVLNNYDRETTHFHDWTVHYDAPTIRRIIEQRSGRRFGRIRALVPVERGPGGRITLLRICGEHLTMEVGKELMIRRCLSESHLYSSAFDVEYGETDGEGYPQSFTLTGRGWGHGVGLCQIGAAVMAANGKDYHAILAHYFPVSQLSTTLPG